MAYAQEFEIRSLPTARTDGSGCVDHDIYGWFIPDDADPDTKVLMQHKTISCPADEVQTACAGPGVPALYKAMLGANLKTMPVPITGWSTQEFIDKYEANVAASAAVASVNALRNWSTPYFFPK